MITFFHLTLSEELYALVVREHLSLLVPLQLFEGLDQEVLVQFVKRLALGFLALCELVQGADRVREAVLLGVRVDKGAPLAWCAPINVTLLTGSGPLEITR